MPVSLVWGALGSREMTGSIIASVPRELMRKPALVSHQSAVRLDRWKASDPMGWLGDALTCPGRRAIDPSWVAGGGT
jgi:hypothetical protein